MGWVIGIAAVGAALIVLVFLLRRGAGASQARGDASRERRPGKSFGITWFPPGTSLDGRGFQVTSPGVYASLRAARTDPSEILLHEAIARNVADDRAQTIEDPGAAPSYARLTPAQRARYLRWLSLGAGELPPADRYLILYYCGIERRLLIDDADHAWGLREVVRLRNLDRPRTGTPNGRMLRRCSTAFLWYEIARSPQRFEEDALTTAAELTERWTEDLLSAPLAWLITHERPLPAWLAQRLAELHPAAPRSVVARRLPQELSDLFETRYRDTYGEGMALRTSKRPAWQTYRPANSSLGEMRSAIPNALGAASQFKEPAQLLATCIADLRRLSRVTAAAPEGDITVQAWEAMPPELRAETDHPLSAIIAQMLEHSGSAVGSDGPSAQATPTGGPGLLTCREIGELLGIASRETLTTAQSRRLAGALHDAGYTAVPDARISPIRYGWDDLIAVIPGAGEPIDPHRLNAASCVLRLGMFVALADGEADGAELRVLHDHLGAVFDLSAEELLRIEALRHLLLATGSDIAPLARRMKALMPDDARLRIGRLLVAVAAARDGIDQREREALRAAFKSLGLALQTLDEAITLIAPAFDHAPVQVRPPKPGAGGDERIPPLPATAPAPAHAFRLNHEAISEIMSQTREVSLMLARAMYAEESEEEESGDSTPPTATTTAANPAHRLVTDKPLPPRYEQFLAELLVQPRWPRDDADRLARSHGIMLDAGLESINDWAFDALGATLIDEEDGALHIDRSLLPTDPPPENPRP